MRHGWADRAKALACALLTTLALAGCTIPFVNIELPWELPDLSGISLPQIDLESLPVPSFTLPIGVTTSVDEARGKMLKRKDAAISDDALVSPGCLTVGLKTASSSAPLCVAGEGNRVYGLDVDIAAALASELGLKVRYVSVVDTTTLGSDCDVVMDAHADTPGKLIVAGTYVESATSFFHKGANAVVVPTDLGGRSVGLQGGSMSEAVLNGTGLKMSQRSCASLNEAFEALASGEVDYVLCEAYPGAYLATFHGGIGFAGCLEAPEAAGIVVRSDNAELLEAVQEGFKSISSNGILDLARARWVGTMPTLTSDTVIQNVPKKATSTTTAAEPSGEEDSEG